MRKISIRNKFNHKPQALARVCEENKEKELEEKTTALKNILWLKDRFWKAVEKQRHHQFT